jgi:hypothetical protein
MFLCLRRPRRNDGQRIILLITKKQTHVSDALRAGRRGRFTFERTSSLPDKSHPRLMALLFNERNQQLSARAPAATRRF